MNALDPEPEQVGQMLREARRRTLELVCDLEGEQLFGPRLPIINPPLWEIGHLAWFQERWTLRHLHARPPILAQADALYDSSAIPQAARWDLPLPSIEATLGYLEQVLEKTLETLERDQVGERERLDFYKLALLHEDMHAEALCYTRQTLSYPAPVLSAAGSASASSDTGAEGALPGDALVPGGEFSVGALPGPGFVFDNEKWAHPVRIEPFAIARAALTQGDYAAFVEDSGYERESLWCPAGWRWRQNVDARHPVYWKRDGGGWLRRHYDRWVPLQEHRPVLHVSWYEADAYCRWAGRRLPTEAEWELAASGTGKRLFPWGGQSPEPSRANLDAAAGGCIDVGALEAGDSAYGCRQMLGNVWEWTASDFLPYPGFKRGPYAEYSEPWFGTHKVLRGGCWFTRSRLIRNTWRNFYTSERRDVWAGLRTCALVC